MINCSREADLWVVIVCVRSSAFLNRSSSVGCRAGKEDEILIWIRDYKGSGTPWLLLKCLVEGNPCSLITPKQLFVLRQKPRCRALVLRDAHLVSARCISLPFDSHGWS